MKQIAFDALPWPVNTYWIITDAGLGGDGPIAQSFTTPSGPTWTNLIVNMPLLGNNTTKPTAGITITLRANNTSDPNADQPGVVLYTLAVVTDNHLYTATNSDPNHMFTINASVSLAPSTRYWVYFHDTLASATNTDAANNLVTKSQAQFASSPPGTGVAGEFQLSDGTYDAVGNNAPIRMQVVLGIETPAWSLNNKAITVSAVSGNTLSTGTSLFSAGTVGDTQTVSFLTSPQTDFEWQGNTGLLYPSQTGSQTQWTGSLITVTYDAGWVLPNDAGVRTLPYDIEDVCLDLVKAAYFARGVDPSVILEVVEGVGRTGWSKTRASAMSLDEGQKEILAAYRSVTF